MQGAVAIFLVFAVAAMAFSPVLPLTDAYALSGLGARGRAYGPVRLWGSAAFVAGNVAAGLMLERFAPGGLIWLIVAALVLSVIAAVALDPVDAGSETRNRGNRIPFGEIIAQQSGVYCGRAGVGRDPEQPRALLRVFHRAVARRGLRRHADRRFMGHRRHRRDRAVRAVGPAAGTAQACGVDGDRRRGRDPALDRDGVRSAGRAALPLQILHAASFAATHLGLMGFMARSVPREFGATAQGFVATLSGVVNATATLASGFVYAAMGGSAYLLMSALALIGVPSAVYAGAAVARLGVCSKYAGRYAVLSAWLGIAR